MNHIVSYDLPAAGGPAADAALYAFLQGQRGQPVCLCAPPDFRLSSGLLQLLLVAAADWQARGLAFTIEGLSAGQSALLDLTGLAAFLPGQEAAICP